MSQSTISTFQLFEMFPDDADLIAGITIDFDALADSRIEY